MTGRWSGAFDLPAWHVRVGVSILLGLLLVLMSVPRISTSQPLSADQDPTLGEGQTTALLVAATPARQVLGSDGRAHVAYDLLLTNVFGAAVSLTSVEVLTPDGMVLLRLTGDVLHAVTQPVYGGEPTDQIAPGGVVAMLIDLSLLPNQLPERLSHRTTYALAPGGPAIIASREILGPELVVELRPPVVIAPPLRGAGWFNGNGCCAPSPHRTGRLVVDGSRYVKPETFAVDWLQLQSGHFFTGEGTAPAEWFGYGAEVLAVAAGTVVFVADGLPDETPFHLPSALERPGDYAGNQIVLQIGPDTWAIYGHLQLGGMMVRVGDEVVTGQPLGRLGNSGNSLAPHLHFQVSDGPVLVSANSVPFVLDRYQVVGTVDPTALAAAFSDPSGLSSLPVTALREPQVDTLPLITTVVDFPQESDRRAQ